jgi:hypothetical protein
MSNILFYPEKNVRVRDAIGRIWSVILAYKTKPVGFGTGHQKL